MMLASKETRETRDTCYCLQNVNGITNLYCCVSGYNLRKFTGTDEAASVVCVRYRSKGYLVIRFNLNKQSIL